MDFSSLKKAFQEKGFDFSRPFIPYSFDMQEYVRRYDVVFRTPMKHGFEGLPIGNGDLGAMFWNEAETLMMQINKCDLWAQPDGETSLLLRSAARLKIDFGMPLFDFLYLKDFDGRLSIANAEASFRTKTPFASVSSVAYADVDKNLIAIEIDCETAGPATLHIDLERYGSRAGSNWYAFFNPDAEQGLGRAKAGENGEAIWIVEDFGENDPLSCATAATVLEPGTTLRCINGRRAEIGVDTCGKGKLTLLVAVVSSHESEDPLRSALELLESGKADFAAIRERKNRWWKDFWNRSYVSLSQPGREADYDYLANLYYMQQYIMGVGSRGEYLMTFNGGTFTWNRDVRQWVNPHHWNTQQAYWPVQATNRPELMLPYIKTYTRIIPQAQAYAKKTFGIDDSIVITEMHDVEGRMLAYKYTLTPAPQMAMHFWEHYLFNGDIEYLRTTGFPFIAGCANTYANYAKYNEVTGKYDIGPASPYETACNAQLYNTCVDGVMSRYILSTALKAAEILGIQDERTEKWKKVLDNIFDFVYECSYTWPTEGDEYLAVGLGPDKKSVVQGNAGFVRNASPLMPTAIIGMKDKGTRLYNAVENSVKLYQKKAMAIVPKASLENRLGMGDQAVQTLFEHADVLQHFPQGLYFNLDHWHIYSRYVANKAMGAQDENGLLTPYSQRDYMYDTMAEHDGIRTGDRIVDTPTQPFVQLGFEGTGLMCHAYHEIALQSYEGVIRVYAALKENYTGSFTLKAAGGFMVSGAYAGTAPVPYIIIKSLLGNRCVVDVSFEGVKLCDAEGNEVAFSIDADGFTVFDTEPGKTYILWSDALNEADIPDMNIEMYVNNDWRSYKNARIGSKRQF